MKMIVISERVGFCDYICRPACEMSKYACMLIDSDYLTSNQLKILEKMGFEIISIKQQKLTTTGDEE